MDASPEATATVQFLMIEALFVLAVPLQAARAGRAPLVLLGEIEAALLRAASKTHVGGLPVVAAEIGAMQSVIRQTFQMVRHRLTGT